MIPSRRQADIGALLRQDGLTKEELQHIRLLHLRMDGPRLEPQAKIRPPYDSLYVKLKRQQEL